MGNKSAKLEQSSPAVEKTTSVSSYFKTRFKMCPNKNNFNKKFKKYQKNSVNNRPQMPLPKESNEKEKENEWTEVLLQVPSSPPGEIRKDQSKPNAPPRKHRQRTPVPDQVHHYEQLTAELQNSTDKIPVQEEIIVPKKEPVHICDGTHRHCINIVNGKVIESTVSKNTSNPSNKSTSSSSLPNHDDLLRKDDKIQKQKIRSSHSSLSSEKIQKNRNSTTEKLESFITRWKSFGSILPSNKKMTENTSSVENKIASEESWDGSDCWAQNVIESDIIVEPIVPTLRKRVRGSSQTDVDKKKILKLRETNSLNSVDEVSDDKVSNANHKSAGGMCEDLKTFPFKARNSSNVFESDTFFTTEFLKKETEASSLQLQPYPNKPTYARRCTFKDDIDQVNANISNKKLDDSPAPINIKNTEIFEKTKDENLEDFCNEFDKINPKPVDQSTEMLEKAKDDKDSDELLATLQDFCNEFDKMNPKVMASKNAIFIESKNAKKENRPQVTPRRKSGIGHSNLLKILQQNSPTTKLIEVELDKSTDEGSKISKSSLEDVEDKTKRLDTDFPEVDEPKITPELKSIECSWQELMKRDQEDTLSNVTEFESAVSEQPDSSSVSEDDFKSNHSSKHLYPSR